MKIGGKYKAFRSRCMASVTLFYLLNHDSYRHSFLLMTLYPMPESPEDFPTLCLVSENIEKQIIVRSSVY